MQQKTAKMKKSKLIDTKLFLRNIVVYTISSISSILYFSCNQKNMDIEYYEQSNNKYKTIYHFQNYDSVVVFYRNGKMFKTGKQDKNNNLFGKWNYYNIDGFLSDTREFFIIGNDSKLNQIWFFNKKKDTITYSNPNFNVYNQEEFGLDTGFDSSVFIYLSISPKKDTFKVFEKISIDIQDATPFWRKKGSECFVVLGKEKNNFNDNFSNLYQVKSDTIRNLYSIKSNNIYEKTVDLKNTVGFEIYYKTPGEKILRGYMVESWKRKPTVDDSIKYRERKIYFEKTIYVKVK